MSILREHRFIYSGWWLTCVHHVLDESKKGLWCVWQVLCVCTGWQMMGALSSSPGNSQACLWVHNRVALPLVIGNNSPSSPGHGVVNFGLEGDPLRGVTAGDVNASDVLSETGNEWEKEAETTLCCQTTGLIEVWAGSRRSSSLIKRIKGVFFSSKQSANCVHRAQCNFCHSTPRVQITKFLLCGARERKGGGRGLV